MRNASVVCTPNLVFGNIRQGQASSLRLVTILPASVLHISVIRHEHYYFLLDYLAILSIHHYTLIYWHYCYVIIIFKSFNIY